MPNSMIGTSEGVDWYMYTMFAGHRLSPRLVCRVCSGPTPCWRSDPEGIEAVTEARQARKELEQKLGPEASAINRKPEPILREALALKY